MFITSTVSFVIVFISGFSLSIVCCAYSSIKYLNYSKACLELTSGLAELNFVAGFIVKFLDSIE